MTTPESTSTVHEEEQEHPPFELESKPSFMDSIAKLKNGFCGGLFNGGDGFELPADSTHSRGVKPVVVPTAKTNDVVHNLKQALPQPEAVVTPTSGCNDTLGTASTGSVASGTDENKGREVKTLHEGDAIEVQVVAEEEKKEEEATVEVVKRGLDASEPAEETTTTIKEEDKASPAETPVEEPESKSYWVVTVLFIFLVAFLGLLLLGGDGRVEFSQHGLETLLGFDQMKIQSAVESEVVQSTKQKIDLQEIVREVLEEANSNNKIMASLEGAYALHEEAKKTPEDDVKRETKQGMNAAPGSKRPAFVKVPSSKDKERGIDEQDEL